MSYLPDCGDLIEMDFAEGEAGETRRRLFLVLSPKAFQETLQIAWVSPISFIKSRHLFQIDLPDTVQTFGTVKLEHLQTVDFGARNLRFVEKVPASFLNRCRAVSGRVLGF